MKVDWVELTTFRSYERLEWAPDPGVNLLVGRNGAGKTNLLEAVSYLSTLKSFRGSPDEALIAEGAASAVVRASVAVGESRRLVEMEIPRSGARVVQVEKARLRRSGDLLGTIRVVAFLPDDIDLVKRGPSLRREMLDDLAIQLWPASHQEQSEFDRSLRQRNAFLKSGSRDTATLDVWDSRLALSGGKVVARRARLIELLRPLLSSSYGTVSESDAGVGLKYTTSWDGSELAMTSAATYTDAINEGLEQHRRFDYERRMTSVGPHRDEPSFQIRGVPARTQASQGEQRTLALAVKLASHTAILQTIDQPPVLLLDDVFSELDIDRAGALARHLPKGTQTMITSARPEDLPLQGRTWAVGGGAVT